jgi:flagellar biosynthetic protein FliQ
VTFADAIGLGREAIFVTLMVSAPVLILSMAVGLIISIFQAVTQIQEPTLAFIPKILVSGLAILFFGPFMLALITDFAGRIFAYVGHIPIR